MHEDKDMDGRLTDDIIMSNVRNAVARRNLPLVITVSWEALFCWMLQ